MIWFAAMASAATMSASLVEPVVDGEDIAHLGEATGTETVILEPYTIYGIDVGLRTSSSAWQTGIPYINLTADDYPGGGRFACYSPHSASARSSCAILDSSDPV